MKSFWQTLVLILIAGVVGVIVAVINDGTKMDAIYLTMLYLIWFELRDR